MQKNGLLTEEECETAKAQPLTVAKVTEEGTKETYQSSYAVHCAAQELMKNDGFEFEYTFADEAPIMTIRSAIRKRIRRRAI